MAYKPLQNELVVNGDAEGEAAKESELKASSQVESVPSVVPKGGEWPWYKVARYVLGVGSFVLLFAFLTSAIVLVALSPPCNADGLVWWKTTVIYQCYPRSFKDTTRDGNGDLPGVLEKLNYLHDLGVKAVWLNPIFKSPQKDNGYDVSNYTDIDPMYGSLDDVRKLLKKMHSKGMHLVLDFVPNHTSEEHPWFKESRSSRSSPKRDWYVWANASANGGPPNNWISIFGGSAWSLDNTTGQYYLHQFSTFQPDLNYHNPDVRKEMEAILSFWFEFGVDGFRIDAVPYLLEDPNLRNETANPKFNESIDCSANSTNRDCYGSLIHNETMDYPGIHDIIRGWRKVADNFKDKFFVGEVYEDDINVFMKYYGNGDEFHFPFNFKLLTNSDWTGDGVREVVDTLMDALPEGAWPNWVLGNHDQPRITSKVGNRLARAMNVLLLTLPGTSTTYYGEEIFMTDVDVPPSEQQDKFQGRDPERTPMQWTDGENAGFTGSGVKPWLPLATNYSTYNVKTENSNSSSMLSLYKRLVELITNNEAFRSAGYATILSDEDVFAFHRFHNETRDEFVVVVNFSESKAAVNLTESLEDESFSNARMQLSSADSKKENSVVDLSNVSLDGGEAVILVGYNSTKAYGNC